MNGHSTGEITLLDALVEMRGGALDLGRPFQRRHRQRPARDSAAVTRTAGLGDGTAVDAVSEIVRTVNSSDRHGSLPSMTYIYSI